MTRTITTAAALAMLGCACGMAHADCGAGPRPTFVIPDGRQATENDMLEAQRDLGRYNDEVRAYANCLQTEQAEMLTNREDAGQLRRKYANLTRDAVAQLASVADCLSQQVIAFKRGGGGNHAQPAACSVGNGAEAQASGASSMASAQASRRPAGSLIPCVQQCSTAMEECETSNIARELTAASVQAAAAKPTPMSCSTEAKQCEAQCRGEYQSK